MNNNIILIGMPGAGKSTIGVLLAKAEGMAFLDTDVVIQDQRGVFLRDLIRDYGIEGFLDIEAEVCTGLDIRRTVVATGGSVVYRPQAMEHLKQLGLVIYLKLDYSVLARRLRNLRHRGVALRKGQTLRMLYEERVPLYEKYADITVECGHQDIERTLDRVMEAVSRHR